MKEMEDNTKFKANRTIALSCAGFVLGMVAMSYAAVPLYELFCQVTGYGGTTQRADIAPETVSDHTITVRFDANVGRNLPWEFEPEVTKMTVQVGAINQAFYKINNLGSIPTGATASFNVTPPSAGAYFNKMQCFCFTEQVLKPGEEQTMPVIFFIDPAYENDPDVNQVDTITLSYTFFPAEIDKETLASLEAEGNHKVQ